jgi:hypothetical protein
MPPVQKGNRVVHIPDPAARKKTQVRQPEPGTQPPPSGTIPAEVADLITPPGLGPPPVNKVRKGSDTPSRRHKYLDHIKDVELPEDYEPADIWIPDMVSKSGLGSLGIGELASGVKPPWPPIDMS